MTQITDTSRFSLLPHEAGSAGWAKPGPALV
jgi:hypothetical protein